MTPQIPDPNDAPLLRRLAGVIVLSIVACVCLFVGVAGAHFDPFPDREEVLLKGSKWGFINAAGKVVIEPTFERAGPFKEGRAAVRISGKWGYIGPDGKIIIEPKYAEAQPFSEGYAAVKTAAGWAYIDMRGVGLTKPEFEAAEPFSGGLARVRANKKYGFIDVTGAVVIPIKYAWADDCGEGLVSVRAEDNGKMVYLDTTGKMAIDPQAEIALRFREGRAIIEVGRKYGVIDRTGKVIVPPQYEGVGWPSGFREGLCLVQKNKKWGYIDRAGSVIIPLKYWSANAFSEGIARVEEKNDETGDWGYIDTTGRLVFANLRVYTMSHNGLLRIQIGEGHAFLDRTGKQVIDKVEQAQDFSEGLAAFGVNLNYTEYNQRMEQIRNNPRFGF